MKDKLIEIAIASWVVVLPMIEVYLLDNLTQWIKYGASQIYIPILWILIAIHYGTLWFAFWVYDKVNQE